MPPERTIAAAYPRRLAPSPAPAEPTAAAPGDRALRDRFLEHVNADPSAVVIEAKYDANRQIEGREAEQEPRLAG